MLCYILSVRIQDNGQLSTVGVEGRWLCFLGWVHLQKNPESLSYKHTTKLQCLHVHMYESMLCVCMYVWKLDADAYAFAYT